MSAHYCPECGHEHLLASDARAPLDDHLTAREQHRLACGTCGKRLRDHIEGVTGHAFVRTFAPARAPQYTEDDPKPSATFCGRCNHLMHWRECLKFGPCSCRNDEAQYTEDDPDWSAMVSPISDTDGGHDDR